MAEELKEIKWFNFFDKQMHCCSISAGEDQLDLNRIFDKIESVVKQNEEMCKQIYYLGLALTGSTAGAHGFLDGWIVRSIRDTMEEEDGKWTIRHSTEAMNKEEIKQHFVKGLRDAADRLENSDDEFDPKNAPVVKNRDDGTELFS